MTAPERQARATSADELCREAYAASAGPAAGVALVYGGMVRSKSVLNMMMMTFGALAAVTVVWVLVGYSLAFGDDLGFGKDPMRPHNLTLVMLGAGPRRGPPPGRRHRS